MKITLSTDTLNSIDTRTPELLPMIPSWYNDYYHLEAGKEHYRLLMYFASIYNYEIIADVGTNMGASALALGSNPTNVVYSMDITNFKPGVPTLPNCEFMIGNVLYDSNIVDSLLKSKFIMLDISHEYYDEIQIYKKLIENGWKGLLCCDDIHLNEPMKRFWSEIYHPKIDITKYGHGSGTGLVIMDDTEIEML